MKPVFRVVLALLVLALGTFASPAGARPRAFTDARINVRNARAEGNDAFCKAPKRPLTSEQRGLCPLADDLDGCAGLVAACRESLEARAPTSEGMKQWLSTLGSLAMGLVWLLIALVLAAIAIPVAIALLKARRDKAVADLPRPGSVALAVPSTRIAEADAALDAETALREANEHAGRGELGRAVSLYLVASLVALDRRGAIRLARHRTNGEYVRACSEDDARRALAAIVREVDRSEFGRVTPDGERVAGVAARAKEIVRGSRGPAPRGSSLLTTTLGVLLGACALGLGGCAGARGEHGTGASTAAQDPAGDQLPMEVLRRGGYDVDYAASALSDLPMPSPRRSAPVVVVDTGRVAIEDEAAAHLLAWVSEGGVLVLFGAPAQWPAALHAEQRDARTTEVEVLGLGLFAGGARIVRMHSLEWQDAEPVASIGDRVYAAYITHGKGMVLGVAGSELVTNVGVARPDNAAAFVALIQIAMFLRDDADNRREVRPLASTYAVRVARSHDGISPATNPFSALIQAGLGKGAIHALAATVVLFLAVGIRHARARPAAPPARRAFAEHVEATGAFYGRARALGHALGAYGRFAEMRLRERLPRGADPVAFLASRAQVPHAEAARIWKRATEARDDDAPRGDELRTIRDLGALLARAFETA